MLRISSSDRLERWPYSADQQPLQCRLQALVGSKRMMNGMLHLYFSLFALTALVPLTPAPRPRASSIFLITRGSHSLMIFIAKWFQTLLSSLTALRNASKFFSGKAPPINFCDMSISFSRFSCGFFLIYLKMPSNATEAEALWSFSFAVIISDSSLWKSSEFAVRIRAIIY